MAPGTSRTTSTPPSGAFTSIEGGSEGFVLWSCSFHDIETDLMSDPAGLARVVDTGEASGLALGLSGARSPSAGRMGALICFVDELHVRGRSVVLHGVPADFATALHLDGAADRVAIVQTLSEAVGILRQFDEMRQRCTSDRGRRINQLRMPAQAMSMAPLCAHARVRLEMSSVAQPARMDLLREAYAGMLEAMARARGDTDDLALSVTVHDGRATLTLLDSGPPCANEVVVPGAGGRVDRIHRFRILDRHNALVLEKDVPEVREMAPETV